MTGHTDRFGVPHTMFGVKDDDHFGAIGRISAVGSMIEQRLVELVAALTMTTEADHAGKSVKDLLSAARRRASSQCEEGIPVELAKPLVELLDEVQDAMWERNAVVHSVWPAPDRAWRGRPKNQRRSPEEFIAWLDCDVKRLVALVHHLVSLADCLRSSRDQAAAFAGGTPAAFATNVYGSSGGPLNRM